MIKIVKTSKEELSEDRLNMLEAQGLKLISVNTYVVKERAFPVKMWIPGMVTPLVDVTHWVYHFRRDPNFVAPGEFNG